MPDKLSTRVDKLEQSMASLIAVVETIADKQARLDDVVVLLTEAQIKTELRFQQVENLIEKRFVETDERFRQLEQRFRETDDRARQTDERIDRLVSAIGEMLRTRNGGTH
jgi:hypothetical protein